MAQWNIKIRIKELDRGQMAVKNRWSKGETVTVQIEPHGTVGMLKQRVALLVAAHEKWQSLFLNDTELPDNAARLDAVEGLTDGAMLDLVAIAPKEEEEDLGELSDDPDGMPAEEMQPPDLPDEAMGKELTDDEQDKQNALKGEASELLEDGKQQEALAKLTEAIMVGNPNAMLLCRRGELLLKLRRPKAAIVDATAALQKNPDSAKAYRLRGKAYRFLSEWAKAVEDFAQCQQIDFDDSIVDVHQFCTKRKVWHGKMEARARRAKEAQEKADAEAAAAQK